ncbi:glycosyltransferase family 2 protein [Ekhidna lutea]|nr:glycosyltransferase family 2 protein [Ekhidna lutea]
MSIKTLTISVCTFRRPNLLRQAIRAVHRLSIPKELEVNFLIVDNDASQEIEQLIREETSDFQIPTRYVAEVNQGLVNARNRVLAEARKMSVDYLAMFDDDDYPETGWLINLWNCLNKYSATVVSGMMIYSWPDSLVSIDDDIKRVYDEKSSTIKTGDIRERCGSGNTLIDFKFVEKHNLSFHEAFNYTGGEDSHFFESVTLYGGKIVKCNEAIVYSEIVEERANEDFIWMRRYNVGYVTFTKNRLLYGRLKAIQKAISMLFRNGLNNLIKSLSDDKRTQIKRKRKAIEMKGLIDSLLGKTYESYKKPDGY